MGYTNPSDIFLIGLSPALASTTNQKLCRWQYLIMISPWEDLLSDSPEIEFIIRQIPTISQPKVCMASPAGTHVLVVSTVQRLPPPLVVAADELSLP